MRHAAGVCHGVHVWVRVRAARRVGHDVPTARICREVGGCVTGCAYGMLPDPTVGHTRPRARTCTPYISSIAARSWRSNLGRASPMAAISSSRTHVLSCHPCLHPSHGFRHSLPVRHAPAMVIFIDEGLGHPKAGELGTGGVGWVRRVRSHPVGKGAPSASDMHRAGGERTRVTQAHPKSSWVRSAPSSTHL